MRDHHHLCLGIYAASEGKKLCAAIVLYGPGGPCAAGVGIGFSISQAGEMLNAGCNPVLVEPVHVAVHHPAAQFRITAERAFSDRHISGIDQHIRIGGKIQIESQLLQIGADRAACFVCSLRVSACADTSHASHIGNIDRAVSDARDDSALLVNSEEGRDGNSRSLRSFRIREICGSVLRSGRVRIVSF